MNQIPPGGGGRLNPPELQPVPDQYIPKPFTLPNLMQEEMALPPEKRKPIYRSEVELYEKLRREQSLMMFTAGSLDKLAAKGYIHPEEVYLVENPISDRPQMISFMNTTTLIKRAIVFPAERQPVEVFQHAEVLGEKDEIKKLTIPSKTEAGSELIEIITFQLRNSAVTIQMSIDFSNMYDSLTAREMPMVERIMASDITAQFFELLGIPMFFFERQVEEAENTDKIYKRYYGESGDNYIRFLNYMNVLRVERPKVREASRKTGFNLNTGEMVTTLNALKIKKSFKQQ